MEVNNASKRQDTIWMPQVEGVTKVNFDHATYEINQQIEIGIVARNHKGELLFLGWYEKKFLRKAALGRYGIMVNNRNMF